MSNYYYTITVQVVDAQTGEPIKGAVLLAQWTKTTAVIERSSHNFKVIEEPSDKQGNIVIPGFYESGVDDPRLVVYKKGYVAWRHDRTFPGYEQKPEFKWRNGNVVELEEFVSGKYTHMDHLSFIRGGYSTGVEYGLFKRAWDWETDLAGIGK